MDLLLTLEAESVDSVVCDPPYHLTSIVKRFGAENAAPAAGGVYNRSARGFMGKQWDGGDIAFRVETWQAIRRVMKPGAFLVAFASTRGYHRMVCAIEDAGFIIHPMLGWVFGSGFPKATRFRDMPELEGWRYGLQALKPALEPICMAQKPMEGTGPQNWRKWGVGGLNIDGCRIEADESTRRPFGSQVGTRDNGYGMVGGGTGGSDAGRWPANVLHDGSDEVLEAFAAFGEKIARNGGVTYGKRQAEGYGMGAAETPVYRDSGSAARFFYSAKADAEDRCCSKHPTIKPLSLMSWLVRLITPPGGTVLDPFAGTGTTLLAADRQQMNAIGIEREAEYVADIHRRLRGDAPLFAEIDALPVPQDPADERVARLWQEPEAL
jgi:site-specific DNA-methyltransferase (adenine-specific)